MQYVWGLLGILGLLLIGFLFCEHKRRIRWRPIIGALFLQLIFGLIVLKWEAGRRALRAVSDGVSNVITYANEGGRFRIWKRHSAGRARLRICIPSAADYHLLFLAHCSVISSPYHAVGD